MPTMRVEMRPLLEIVPYERNPRQNDAAVDAVAASITEFGFRQPIVVDTEGVIICGHTRSALSEKTRQLISTKKGSSVML